MNLKLALRLLARAARYRWKLNAPEIARMLSVLPQGGTAIDIGAHKGAYTFWLARRVGRGGTVVSVEPQQRVAAGLEQSVAAWGMRQVRVINAAASNRAGQGTINIPRDSTHGASMGALDADRAVDVTPVRLVTIDELVGEHALARLDFVKIDAEGHEIEIVEGGLDAIARLRPSLLIESEARAHEGDRSHLDRLRELLEPLGYAGSFHDGQAWLPLDALDVEKHQNYGHGRYCNNIFFAPMHEANRGHRPRTTAPASVPMPASPQVAGEPVAGSV